MKQDIPYIGSIIDKTNTKFVFRLLYRWNKLLHVKDCWTIPFITLSIVYMFFGNQKRAKIVWIAILEELLTIVTV